MWVLLLSALALACALAPPQSTAWMARIAAGRLTQHLFAYSVHDPHTGNLWYWTSPLFDVVLALVTDRGLLSPLAARAWLLAGLFAGSLFFFRPLSHRGGWSYAALSGLLLTCYVSSQADIHPVFITPLFFLWVTASLREEAKPFPATLLLLTLWSAVHESFLLGWLWAAASAARHKDWKSLAWLVALLLTPWGARALMLWSLDPPPLLAGAGALDMVVVIGAAAVLGISWKQQKADEKATSVVMLLSCPYFWTGRALALAWSLSLLAPAAEKLARSPRLKLLRQDLHRGSTPYLVGTLFLGVALLVVLHSLGSASSLYDPWSKTLREDSRKIASSKKLCAPLSLYNTALYHRMPLRPLADARGLYLYSLRDLQTATRIEQGEPFNPEGWDCGALWVSKESELFNYAMRMTSWVPILEVAEPSAVLMVPVNLQVLGQVPAAYQALAKQKLIEQWVEEAKREAEKKNLEGAVKKLKQALELRRDATLLSNLAAIYLQQGKLDHAKILLAEALDLQPINIPARMNLGLYHERRGELKEAAAYYEWVTDFQPENELAREALTRVMKQLDPNYVPPGRKPAQTRKSRPAPPLP